MMSRRTKEGPTKAVEVVLLESGRSKCGTVNVRPHPVNNIRCMLKLCSQLAQARCL